MARRDATPGLARIYVNRLNPAASGPGLENGFEMAAQIGHFCHGPARTGTTNRVSAGAGSIEVAAFGGEAVRPGTVWIAGALPMNTHRVI